MTSFLLVNIGQNGCIRVVKETDIFKLKFGILQMSTKVSSMHKLPPPFFAIIDTIFNSQAIQCKQAQY